MRDRDYVPSHAKARPCSDSTYVWRVLDANANRAAEALRTWEEYARFVIESASLTEDLKQVRHQLAATIDQLGRTSRLAARDTAGDVGTKRTAEGEYTRHQPLDVAQAASARAQQALRCLEEYGKIVTPHLASRFEAIRYQLYDLEARTLDPASRRTKLRQTHICLLTDCQQAQTLIIPQATRVVAAGATMIQLRDKSTADSELLETAHQLRRALPPSALLIINDRPDLAKLADADGVHVGQDDVDVTAARTIVGPSRLVGTSTHHSTQLLQAVSQGADYVGFGPVFPTATKSFRSFVGPQEVSDAARTCPLPLFAIGGIDAAHAAQLSKHGCRRVAVSSAIWQSSDPLAAIAELDNVLKAEHHAETS